MPCNLENFVLLNWELEVEQGGSGGRTREEKKKRREKERKKSDNRSRQVKECRGHWLPPP